MADPNDTLRPVSPSHEAEETTPLLATDDHAGSSSRPQDAAEAAEQTGTAATTATAPPPLPSSKLFRYTKRTTYVSIFSSLIALIFLIAFLTTSMLSPYGWYMYQWADVIYELGLTIFLSIILTILNLGAIRHPFSPPPPPPQSSASSSPPHQLQPRSTFFYLPLTLCVDFIFVLFILALAGRLASDTPFSYYCRGLGDPGYGDGAEDCKRWALALQILCYLSVAGATVVGLCHLFLFALRGITVLRYGLWSQPSAWIIPTTGFSVQFTFKILGSDSVNAVEA